MRLFRLGTLGLLAAAMFSSGCATPGKTESNLNGFFKTPQWMSGKGTKAKPYPSPSKLAVTWTPDTLVQPGKTPTRGFGGRLFFFDQESKSVPVEGTLTVHGFEAGPDGKPQRVQPFKFTPEQFTEHFSESDFGASYSIWIPWDAAGGDQKRVSLVATFQTTEGRYVQGSPTTVILPGPVANPAPLDRDPLLSQQYQNHVTAVENHATRPSGLVTTTIRRTNDARGGVRSEGRPLTGSRMDALLAKARSAQKTSGGQTRFVDLPLNQNPSVMPASAILPNDPGPQRIRRMTR
ncbi:MAG: hypothetical protein AAFU85_24475 [Planctomycetota bacterium]